MTDLATRIGQLECMTPAGLRRVYESVFGEPSRSNNRRWLIRRIAWRLQSEAEGGLSERARTRAVELARDADVRARPPGDFLGSGPTLGAGLRTVTGELREVRDERLPLPGAVLTRNHGGKVHRVTVLSNGFEYEGTCYRSLTKVANAITGSHWNGYAFFGLTGKGARDG